MWETMEQRLPGLAVDADTASPEAWIAAIEGLTARGQPFLAYDLCHRAEERFPERGEIHLLGILALFQGHSGGAARKALTAYSPKAEATPRERELLAEIHRLSWEQWGGEQDLKRARALYTELFEQQASCRHGSEAAVMGWCLGHREEAREIARRLLEQCAEPAPGEDVDERFQRLLHQGQGALVLGENDAAEALFRRAAEASGRDYRPVVEALQRLRILERMGMAVPAALADILQPPRVVIFGGPLIDPPSPAGGTGEAIFPPSKEGPLGRAIAQRLGEIDARIGYSSAACGADLLFIEAMLERGGEIHLVLPCALEDFIEARVAYAGARWRERLEAVLPQAATISYATREHYLGHRALLRYANHIITGLGWLRGEQLLTEPHLLAVWDYRAINTPGSSSDFIDHWPDITTLHLIELDELEEEPGSAIDPPRLPAYQEPTLPERTIRAMLFADVVGYSKLDEEYLPNWFRLLERIHQLCATLEVAPELVETWGDALYIVMPDARSVVRYAFVLREAFSRLDHHQFGLPYQLNVRIGLHAGPVFHDVNPITGRSAFSGRQVNRAARIEPITMPGEVYASQELVALLTAEENAVKHELAFRREPYTPWFKAEYLGILEMPKRHGDQPMYHLLPADDAE
ncbi:adenylate/guanylate cyclase domain-containing protein [Endothiovibrio diazotrophicus]